MKFAESLVSFAADSCVDPNSGSEIQETNSPPTKTGNFNGITQE